MPATAGTTNATEKRFIVPLNLFGGNESNPQLDCGLLSVFGFDSRSKVSGREAPCSQAWERDELAVRAWAQDVPGALAAVLEQDATQASAAARDESPPSAGVQDGSQVAAAA